MAGGCRTMTGSGAKDMIVETGRRGLFRPAKADFPVRYGEYSRIGTKELVMDFDRNGRVRFLQGRGESWPHPLEYLKRTDGNDWVYYGLSEYGDFLDLYGEHYLPCTSYATNRPLGGEPFGLAGVKRALAGWYEACRSLYESRRSLDLEAREIVDRIARSGPERLAEHALELHRITASSIPVLPPDARHVDYDVVPLVLVDGCPYRCRFCVGRDASGSGTRTRAGVDGQIAALEKWLGRQRGNVQGLFLGLHDALSADDDLILWSMESAYRRLGFEGSPFRAPQVCMFGSVDSLLRKKPAFFESLNAQPWNVTINVGLESAHAPALERLGKPLSPLQVDAAFRRAHEINSTWMNVEVTTNFILFPEADEASESSMIELIRRHVRRPTSRSTCYLSPLMEGNRRPRAPRRVFLERVQRIQRLLPVPLYVYLIQRL
jgi:hypothetical protein